MQSLAKKLNTILQDTVATSLFSELGRTLFFPKGIVAQSAEAQKSAHRLNATIGMACQAGKPMIQQALQDMLPLLSPEQIVAYAPTAGIPQLGKQWLQEIIKKNPQIATHNVSTPIVCSGLTHAIALTADLFADQETALIVPNVFWGNYKQIFELRHKTPVITFPFLHDTGGMNVAAFDEALKKGCRTYKKNIVVLNFPNNPTGYSPTTTEAENIATLLKHYAEEGNKLLVILDDAYFGFFYEQDIFPHSLFSLLHNAHHNILAIKIDGITKEEYAWGLRVGFATVGCAGWSQAQYDALRQKYMGAIRSSISNTSNLSQHLISTLIGSPAYEQSKKHSFAIMKERYKKTKEIVQGYQENQSPVLTALPFNSGYFMTFICRNNNAEHIRLALLEKGIGVIAIQNSMIRVAFSCIDVENMEELFTELFSTAQEVSAQ